MGIIQDVLNRSQVSLPETQIQKSDLSKTQAPLRSLETGDRLQGKIISVSDEGGNRNVQISLGGDEVISAKLQDGMSLKEGQYISFEVRGTQGQITLTPLFENITESPTILKALTAADLEASDANIGMVKTMMENGAPIDKESLISMHNLTASHPDTEVSTLVQMKSLNIPITENNIQQFESYKNYEHKVVESFENIMDELPAAYNELASEGKSQAANDMYGNILNMLTKGSETLPKEESFIATIQEAASKVSQGEGNAQGNLTIISEEGAVTEKTAVNAENQNPEVVQNFTLDEEAVTEQQSTVTTGKGILSLEEVVETEGEILETPKGEEQAAAEKAAEGSPEGKNVVLANNEAGTKQGTVISNDLINVLKSVQGDAGLTGDELQKLLSLSNGASKPEIDVYAVLKELSESYNANGHRSEASEEAFSKIFSSDGFNKLVKDTMKDQWLLEPKDVSSKETVESFYQRLNAQAKELTQTLTNTLGAESKAAQSAANLQNNIDFMNELNHMFNYIQLPLKMSESDAHGDLYVYSNGKKKFEQGETVSAILHLDMDNLGPVDVYVKMKDNNVKTNFYVADEEILDLIEEHLDMLTERLEKRGYNVQARMMLHTDKDVDGEDAPVDEMFDINKMDIISVTSFDARA